MSFLSIVLFYIYNNLSGFSRFEDVACSCMVVRSRLEFTVGFTIDDIRIRIPAIFLCI